MRRETTLFWGKAQADGNALSRMHSLVAHSLDVAAVAALLPRPPSFNLAGNLSGQVLGFLAAVHDVGKFSRTFQAKDMAHWPGPALGPAPATIPPGVRHDAMGLYLLRKPLRAMLDPALPPRFC